MPWEIKQNYGDCNGYAVVEVDEMGEVELDACFMTMDEANRYAAMENSGEVMDDEMEEEMEMAQKRDYSTEARSRMAESGEAMDDGSFPIANLTDLGNAIQSVGRAANYEAARRHIISRARALGATDMLPEDWPGSTKGKKYWGGAFDPRTALRKGF